MPYLAVAMSSLSSLSSDKMYVATIPHVAKPSFRGQLNLVYSSKQRPLQKAQMDCA